MGLAFIEFTAATGSMDASYVVVVVVAELYMKWHQANYRARDEPSSYWRDL